MSVKLGEISLAGVSHRVLMTTGFDTFKYYFTNYTIEKYNIDGVYLRLYFKEITTKDMEFPIDIIFLDKNNSILKRVYSVKPGMHIRAPFRTKYALELLPDVSL